VGLATSPPDGRRFTEISRTRVLAGPASSNTPCPATTTSITISSAICPGMPAAKRSEFRPARRCTFLSHNVMRTECVVPTRFDLDSSLDTSRPGSSISTSRLSLYSVRVSATHSRGPAERRPWRPGPVGRLGRDDVSVLSRNSFSTPALTVPGPAKATERGRAGRPPQIRGG
jgi:hypothetical protein